MCTADSPSPEFVSQDTVLALHAYLLAMEAVVLLMEDESLEVDSVVSQLIERELAKV